MPTEIVIANATLVLPDGVIRGAVQAVDGVIRDISAGASIPPGAVDCEQDYLIPGLVELHTDNLERHMRPRPGVDWPRRAAVAAHDGEFASVGVSTVLDALRLGEIEEPGLADRAVEAVEAIAQLRALNLLRADHWLHLRCEVTAPGLAGEFERLAGQDRLKLVSLMDHTPGQRQFADLQKYLLFYQERRNLSDAQMRDFVDGAMALQATHAGPNRRALAARSRERALAIASHDDATLDHVAESAADGVSIAEFPTTLEAARASRAAGLHVLMGAPNLLRGGSHSGNVSAGELAHEGLVDILSSDYAPASLMLAAFKLADDADGYDLPRAIACVTRNPALAVGLDDRGAIAPGLRADFARVYHVERLCVTRALWREGVRVV